MKTIKAFLILLASAGFATPVFGEDRECMSVAVVDGYIEFRNNCKSDIHHNYCIVNPNTTSKRLSGAGSLAALHGCDTGFTGWGRISAGGKSIAVQSDALGENSEIRWFSCPMPALPKDWDWKTNQGFCRTTGDSTAAKRKKSTMVLNRKDRRLLQMALTIKGFDTGTADGQFGPKTQAAIKAWQQSIGQEATGQLTASQVRQLLPDRFGAEPQQAKATTGGGWTAPAPAVALSPKCADMPGSYPATGKNHAWAQCWQELTEQPGCYVYRTHYHSGEKVTRGKGECRGGVIARGTLTIEGNGGFFEGSFVDGKKSGRWNDRDAMGQIGEGPYVDGHRSGRWVERWPDGVEYDGSYDANNEKYWVGSARYPNGIIGEGPYVLVGNMWLKEGRWVYRFPDGSTKEDCHRCN